MIIPRKRDIIKHKAFMDIAFEIASNTIITKSGKLKVRGYWINQGAITPFKITYHKETIEIKPENISQWQIFIGEDKENLRAEEWRDISS